MKECSVCKEEKPLSEFSKKRKTTHQSYCKECQSIYRKEWHEKNKQNQKIKRTERKKQALKFTQDIKKKSWCSVCEEDRWYCLDFHHKNESNKKHDISYMAKNGYSTDAILKEIKKCIVLCKNCHAELHIGSIPLTGVQIPLRTP